METNNTKHQQRLIKNRKRKENLLTGPQLYFGKQSGTDQNVKTVLQKNGGRGVQNGPHRRYQGRLCYYRYCKT